MESSKRNLQKSVRVNGLSISRICLDHLTNALSLLRLSQLFLSIAYTAFVLEEVFAARKQDKEGKMPGEDDIMPQVLKRINIDDIILDFRNKVLLENNTPEQFSILNIPPIPKSKDLSIASNYRGIALTSLVS